MRQYRDEIHAKTNHKVTARWLDGEEEKTPEAREGYARIDLADIDASDLLIAFTESREEATKRGGRHVELGYALKGGRQVWVTPHVENIFMELREVRKFQAFEHVLDELRRLDVPPVKYNRIAMSGFAGSGKDCAAEALYPLGYNRACFGDIIKRQLDEQIIHYFGFSAFTKTRSEKEKIRRTLESWGEDNYDCILAEFLNGLPEKAVNTRLVRVREAKEWKVAGGIIVDVVRPGVMPATPWEADRHQELVSSGLIDMTLWNSGAVEELHAKIRKIVGVK